MGGKCGASFEGATLLWTTDRRERKTTDERRKKTTN